MACLEAVAALHFPVFVKPARGGSSLGISKVDDPAGLEAAIDVAQRYDPKVIVEQGFVGARELECGVLADPAGGPPQASEMAEIRMHNESGFYDFDAKYLPEEQVELDVPADVEPDLAEQVQAAGGADVRGDRLRGPGPGGRLRHRRGPGGGQRDQHHARLHPALDVPADVGRQWRGLSGADRPADHLGAAAPGRSALTGAGRDQTAGRDQRIVVGDRRRRDRPGR